MVMSGAVAGHFVEVCVASDVYPKVRVGFFHARFGKAWLGGQTRIRVDRSRVGPVGHGRLPSHAVTRPLCLERPDAHHRVDPVAPGVYGSVR